jgi:hypothetical protein
VLGTVINAGAAPSSKGNGNGNGNGGNSITNSREGLFILQGAGLLPGNQVSGSITLSIQGQASSVSLTESSITHGNNCTGCPSGFGTGDLSKYLRLTVVDTTTSTTIYNGVLAPSSGPLSPGSPVTVCGVGTAGGPKGGECPAWANKESHALTFTVAFPSSTPAVDDLYQGTSASLQFNWTRAKA